MKSKTLNKGSFVKIRVTEKPHSERMWFELLNKQEVDGHWLVRLNSYPIVLKNIKFGDVLDITEDEIIDVYIEN